MRMHKIQLVFIGLWFSAEKCTRPKVALCTLIHCWRKDSWIKQGLDLKKPGLTNRSYFLIMSSSSQLSRGFCLLFYGKVSTLLHSRYTYLQI